MNYIQKILVSLSHILLNVDPIYDSLRNRISRFHEHASRFEMSDAFAILEDACPRPKRNALPTHRDWPTTPFFDVSIIVPCYNVEDYVVDCIESISHQRTSCTFEIIAVDDGSADVTGELLDNLALGDARLRVIHQSNRGFSGARNVGISLAQGKALIFVDSDDVLEPDAVEALFSELDSSGCDFVTANYSRMGANGEKRTKSATKRTHGAPWSRIYSREVWRRIEFPEGYWFEDTVQSYCIDPLFKDRYLDRSLYRHRVHGESITATCSRSKKGLDTFWIIGEMLSWCRELGIPLSQELFDQTIKQMGPLMRSRTLALSKKEKEALFAACCYLLASYPEFDGLETSLGGVDGTTFYLRYGRRTIARGYLLLRLARPCVSAFRHVL